MKEKLRKLFMEVLECYEDAETNNIVEWSGGNDKNFVTLKERIEEYKQKFDKIINEDEDT